MGDDLQDKPRKELKELCSRNNIRTAGVKHEDLVRLLRNKLYPSTPSTPRSTSLKSTRVGPKEPSPVKDTNAGSNKTPVKSGGNKARNPRTPPSLPRENEKSKEIQRKNWGLSRKPLLTKSNTFTSRSRAPDGCPKVDQENAHTRPVASRVKGLSPLSRRSGEETMSTQSESRLEDDSASDASRRVSEVATDAGPDTMSDFSDADEFRSVSSEPISRLGKRASSLRTEASLLSAQSGLSFFTAGSWSSENSRSLENLRGEDVFPELPDGSDFLGDALEVSFLDAGAADPEMVRFTAMHSPMARDYVNYNRGSKADALESSAAPEEGKHPRDMELGETSEDLVSSMNDHAPCASGDAGKKDCEDDQIASEESKHLRDTEFGETSQSGESKDLVASKHDLAPEGDMAKDNCEDDHIASEEGKHPRDLEFGETSEGGESKDFDLAPGVSGDTAKEDCEEDHQTNGVKCEDVEGWAVDTPMQCEPCAREDAVIQPTPEDERSGLPEGEESGSPAFDYSVAKKLEFEPVEITSVPPAEPCNEESESRKRGPAAHVPAETVDPSDSSPPNTEEPAEEAGCPVDEREGSTVKSGDEVHDYNKPRQEGREKEDMQATLSFPMSVVLWCSQSCSSTFGRRTRTLTS